MDGDLNVDWKKEGTYKNRLKCEFSDKNSNIYNKQLQQLHFK